ncbi:MAG: PIN domain-containing protein [Asgard group archaeon]|nr:PIN domain-containing protein [Asgard group archaeon]
MAIQVLVDTNVLLLAAEGKFNLDAEIDRLVNQKYDFIFLSACLEELEFIKEKNAKLIRKIVFAKTLLKKIKIIDFNPPQIKTVDEKIIQYAKENSSQCVVLTNDLPLKESLLANNIPVINIRKKNHLELIGVLPS